MMTIPVGRWDGMRVLTVREPWASLIVSGQKDIENRAWRCGYEGPLLIHASKTLTLRYYWIACAWVKEHIEEVVRINVSYPTFEECKSNRGKIIGGCHLCGCRRLAYSFWFDGSGFAWQLGGAWRAEQPVPFKGQLRLGTFRLPEKR